MGSASSSRSRWMVTEGVAVASRDMTGAFDWAAASVARLARREEIVASVGSEFVVAERIMGAGGGCT